MSNFKGDFMNGLNVEQFVSMAEWHKPRRRVWAKIISIVVSVTFMFPYLTWAFEATSFPQPANLVMFNQQPIRIAHKLGTITQSFQGSDRLVVHVQDLHCNYEVQNNIARMIDVLAGEHGLELVGIEGASLPVNATILSTFPVEEVKKETAHYLVKQGKLTGAEMYAGIGQHRIRLEGIESADLYAHNRTTVMKFLNYESQGYIFDLRETLDELKRDIYNPVLTALDKKKQAFREGDLSLLKYSVYLYSFARQSREDLSLYPNLRAYVSKRKAMFSDLVDSDGLFNELDRLDQSLRARLYTSAEQEKLDLLSHRLDIMEKLVNISASPQDLAEYRAAPEGFRVQKFLDFIARHDELEEFILDAEVYKLDEYLGEVRNFYQVADDRSRAFVENIMARMQKHRTKVSMLVTGGYHTDMVLEELKQKGVSYVCIKPRLSRQDIVNPYFALLRERRTPLEKLLAQNQNILGIEVMLHQTGKDTGKVMTFAEFLALSPKEQLNVTTIITILKAGLLASLISKKTSAAGVLTEYKLMIQNYAADRSQVILKNLKTINENALVARFTSGISMLVHRLTGFTSSINIAAEIGVGRGTAQVIPTEEEGAVVENFKTWSARPASIFVGIQERLARVAEWALKRLANQLLRYNSGAVMALAMVGMVMGTVIPDADKPLDERYIIWDEESGKLSQDVGQPLVGGKTYQLGVLNEAHPEISLRSLGATSKACVDFLASDPELLPYINKLTSELDTSDEIKRVEVSRQIMQRIIAAEIPVEISNEIKTAYNKLCEIIANGKEVSKIPVGIRSAGKAEDISLGDIPELKDINLGANAGQHDTLLGVTGAENVVDAWRACVASLFTDRVLDYRDGMMVYTAFGSILPDKKMTQTIISTLNRSENKEDRLVARALNEPEEGIKIITSLKFLNALERNGFENAAKIVKAGREEFMNIEKIAMGVTIMPMAGVDISYVNFASDLMTGSGWTGFTFQQVPPEEYVDKGRVFTVTFMNDIGESIVQGLATADTYLVHVFEDENGEHVNILWRELGTKIVRAILKKPIMEELGLSEDNLVEILAAYSAGFKYDFSDQLSHKLFNGQANLQKCHQSLAGLIEVGVSDTENIEVDSETLAMFNYNRGQLNLLAHLLKRMMENRKEQTIFTVVPKELRDVFVGFDSQVKDVVREICMPAQEDYGHLLDTEGAVGLNLDETNKAVILQRRPSNAKSDINNPRKIEISYTYVKKKDLDAVKELKEEIGDTGLKRGDLLCQGIPTRNAFSGMIYKIDENQDLAPQFEKIKKLADSGVEIIIRCRETTPDFVPILKHPNVKGVIANVGGATSHAAVISRELGIATVVGIQAWLHKLEEEVGAEKAKEIIEYLNTAENIVTVDANSDETGRGNIYAGKTPIALRKITIPTDRLPKIFTKFGYIMGMAGPMLAMSKIAQYAGYTGVALMRAEFVYGEENINPRGGVAYDNLMVYNYLMSKGEGKTAGEFRAGLSPAEEEALQKVEMELIRRQEARQKGIEVDVSELERLINEHKTGEVFIASLSKYAQGDLFSIKKHPEEISKATARLMGYLSYDKFFDAVHGGAVATMAAANSKEKNTVVYRSIDFKKNEAKELIFSNIFDPEPEIATMLGERGARWLLQPENQVILRKEIRLLLKQVANGYTNLGFMFPFVSTPEELQQLLDITAEEEKAMSKKYNRPVYLRKVGQMVELPSNVIQADEFAKILIANREDTRQWFKSKFNAEIKRNTFFSFGTNDLTQTTLLADRDQPEMKELFDESHEFVIESIRRVVNVAIVNKIECGLCGQAIVNLVNTKPEAAEEILMLLGSTGGYAGTDYLGTEITIVRSASATLKHGVCRAKTGVEALIDGFLESRISKGAAVRPLYRVKSEEDLKKTYIGDYVLIDNPEFQVDIEDDDIIGMIERWGAVICSAEFAGTNGILIDKIKALRVPVIILEDIESLRNLPVKEETPEITIDFTNQKIYAGEQEVEIVVPEKPSKIKIVETATNEPEKMGFDNSVPAAQFYNELGIHPVAFMAYDNKQQRKGMDTGVTKAIENIIKTNEAKSAQEAYQKELAKYFRTQVENEDGKYVYETSDMESDDSVKLKGHEVYIAEEEINPPLGFTGLDSLVRDPQLRTLFKLEMEVIKQLRDEGYDIAIQFNTVKVLENLEEALKVLIEAGIDPDKVKLGMDTASPGNYLFTSKFIETGHLDFITLDERRLAQAYLAAHLDGKNKKVTAFYTPDKIQKSLVIPIAMIKQAAYDGNIAMNVKMLEEGLQQDTPRGARFHAEKVLENYDTVMIIGEDGKPVIINTKDVKPTDVIVRGVKKSSGRPAVIPQALPGLRTPELADEPVNTPMLQRISPVFDRLPGLQQRLMFLYTIGLRVLLGTSRLEVTAQAVKESPIIEALTLRHFPQFTAEMMTDITMKGVDIEALSLKSAGSLAAYLKGLVLGTYKETNEKCTVCIPSPVLAVLMRGRPTPGAGLTAKARFVLARRLMGNMLWVQSRAYRHETIADSLGWNFHIKRALTPTETMGFVDVAKMQKNNAFKGRKGTVHVTSAEIFNLYQACMEEARQLTNSEFSSARQELLEMLTKLKTGGEVPDINIMFTALEKLGKTTKDPVIAALHAISTEAQNMPENKREILTASVLETLIKTLAEPVKGNELQTRAGETVSANQAVDSVQVMGLPEDQATAMISAIDAALTELSGNMAAAGTIQRMKAVQAALAASQGVSLDSTAVMKTPSGERLDQILISAIAEQAAEPTVAMLGLGLSLNMFGLAAGGKEVELEPGVTIAQANIAEIPSAATKSSEVLAQVKAGKLAVGTRAWVFTTRRVVPDRVENRAPIALTTMMLAAAEVLPAMLSTAVHKQAQQLNPVWYADRMMAQLNPELRTLHIAENMVDVNADNAYGRAYRAMVNNPSPENTARLWTTTLHMARTLETGTLVDTLNQVLVSKYFHNMKSVPTVAIAEAEKEAAGWSNMPAGLRMTDRIFIPVAAFDVRCNMGALGFVTRTLKQGGLFSVMDEVLELFLRKGLRYSTKVAA